MKFFLHFSSKIKNNIGNISRVTYLVLFLYTLGIQVQGQLVTPPKQWDKTIGGPVDDYFHAMVATPDGGYLIGGYSLQGLEGSSSKPSEGLTDYLVVKIDKNGKREWDKSYGGNNNDFLYSITATPDSGYLLGGYSFSGISGDKTQASRGGYDYWIVKIDKDGKKQWDKTYGGSDFDFLYSIVNTPDGGYLLGGHSSSDIGGEKSQESRGSADYWVVKIDKSGNLLWDKTFGGSDDETFKSVINSPDGGFILGGYTQSGISGEKSDTSRGLADYWIVKIDKDGKKLWDKTFGGNSLDELTSIIATSDNGYLLGGDSYSRIGGDKSEGLRGFNDYWIIKIDKDGKKLWDKRYGGTLSDYFSTVIGTTDGGYLLGGYSSSGINEDKSDANKGEFDYWIIKTNDSGTKQWDKSFGGKKSDNLVSIITTKDSGFMLGGQSNSDTSADKSEASQGSNDFWLVKLGTGISKNEQAITFSAVPVHTYGDADFVIQASASSGLPVTFTLVSGAAIIHKDTVTIKDAGTITIRASQEGDSVYYPATPVSRSFNVSKATPIISWNPVTLMQDMPLGNGQLNAMATFKNLPVNGSFVYDPPAGSLLTAGTQILKADFNPTDTVNFNAIAGITRSIVVSESQSFSAINSFIPTLGWAGFLVVINGNNLGKSTGVYFNGVSAPFAVINYNLVIAIVPVGATTGRIGIRSSGGNVTYSKNDFRITSYWPFFNFLAPASALEGKTGLMPGAALLTINEEANAASIYPNPFKNSFKIGLKGRQEVKVPAILYSIDGKVIMRIPNVQSGQQVDVGSGLRPGVYILQLGVGKDSKKYKIIKAN